MSNYSGSPAFPSICESVNGVPIFKGMTLRDYFAAKAMQSIILDPWYANQERSFEESGDYIAADAYIIADAMLAERNK